MGGNKIDACQKEINRESRSLDAIVLEMDKKVAKHAEELKEHSNNILSETVQKLKVLIKQNADGYPRLEGLIEEERQARRNAIEPILKELKDERLDREKDERKILEMVEANMSTIWKMQS